MSTMTQYVNDILNNVEVRNPAISFYFSDIIGEYVELEDYPKKDTKKAWEKVLTRICEENDLPMDWEGIEDYINEMFGCSNDEDRFEFDEDVDNFKTPFDSIWHFVTKEYVATEE